MQLNFSFIKKPFFIKIENWKPKHAKSLVTVANNEEIAQALNCNFPYPYTELHAKEWIQYCRKIKDSKDTFERAIVIDDKVAGGVGVYFSDNMKRAKIGYWLGKNFWGNGIMSEIVSKITENLRKIPSLEEIYTVVWKNNIGSKKVLEKNNFVSNNLLSAQNSQNEIVFYSLKLKDNALLGKY